MQQYRDTDYAAVSAALHAREAKLLTQAMAERMIDAATPEESYKTLWNAATRRLSDARSKMWNTRSRRRAESSTAR